MSAHVCKHAHFSIHDPLDMYLKQLRKIFPNFPKKKKLKIIIFKNSKFLFSHRVSGHLEVVSKRITRYGCREAKKFYNAENEIISEFVFTILKLCKKLKSGEASTPLKFHFDPDTAPKKFPSPPLNDNFEFLKMMIFNFFVENLETFF